MSSLVLSKIPSAIFILNWLNVNIKIVAQIKYRLLSNLSIGFMFEYEWSPVRENMRNGWTMYVRKIREGSESTQEIKTRSKNEPLLIVNEPVKQAHMVPEVLCWWNFWESLLLGPWAYYWLKGHRRVQQRMSWAKRQFWNCFVPSIAGIINFSCWTAMEVLWEGFGAFSSPKLLNFSFPIRFILKIEFSPSILTKSISACNIFFSHIVYDLNLFIYTSAL